MATQALFNYCKKFNLPEPQYVKESGYDGYNYSVVVNGVKYKTSFCENSIHEAENRVALQALEELLIQATEELMRVLRLIKSDTFETDTINDRCNTKLPDQISSRDKVDPETYIAVSRISSYFKRYVTSKFPGKIFSETSVLIRGKNSYSYDHDRVQIKYYGRDTYHLGDYDYMIDISIIVNDEIVYSEQFD